MPGREDTFSRYIRGHGGTLAHVLNALGRFESRYAHWPDRLFLYPETLAALVQDLTPLGFYMMQLKVSVISDLERDLFCTDLRGNISVYRIQTRHDDAASRAAAIWLGLCCDDTTISLGGEHWG